MSKELNELDGLLHDKGKRLQTMTLQWAKVTSVDWDKKECEANGIDDDLPFYDILLGIGSINIKPKIGSKILVGLINNDVTTPVLISAEEIEEIQVKTSDCEFDINKGFLLKKENETLAKLMSDLLKEIQRMKFTTNAGPTVNLINRLKFKEIENRFKDFLKED